MLTKTERREKRQKLRGESVCRIIEMNVKVTGDEKFMGCGCSGGEKRTEVIDEDREWFRMNVRRCILLSQYHYINLITTGFQYPPWLVSFLLPAPTILGLYAFSTSSIPLSLQQS